MSLSCSGDFQMISNELMEVCLKISYFYLEKNFDDYEAAEKEILSLLITNVEISEDGKSVYNDYSLINKKV